MLKVREAHGAWVLRRRLDTVACLRSRTAGRPNWAPPHSGPGTAVSTEWPCLDDAVRRHQLASGHVV